MKEIEIIKSDLVFEDYKKDKNSPARIKRIMKYRTYEGIYFMISIKDYGYESMIMSEADYLKISFEE